MDAEIIKHIASTGNDATSHGGASLGSFIGAGVAVLGGLGTGLSQGFAAGKAAEAVGRNPEAESKIRTTLIVGCAIAETSAIYGLIIGILLIFVATKP